MHAVSHTRGLNNITEKVKRIRLFEYECYKADDKSILTGTTG